MTDNSCARLSFLILDQRGTLPRKIALAAAQVILDGGIAVYQALPECGGAVSGDLCSAGTSTAKITNVAIITGFKAVSTKMAI